MKPSTRVLGIVALPLVLLGLIQLVPYGRDHANPPAGASPAWDSDRTLALARRACFDCHSNETRWPWYASIAPISWRIQTHVREGRAALNFTAFDAGSEKMAEGAGEAAETIQKGEMPPNDYLLLHPEARLTPAEKRALADGLAATFAPFAEREGRRAHAAQPERGRDAGKAEDDGKEVRGEDRD